MNDRPESSGPGEIGERGAGLSPEERREIDAAIARFPSRRSVAIEAMRIVQRRRGWLSDEALAAVADFVGTSADDLDGVATFYNLILRRPVGRHVVLYCDSVSCWIMGSDRLREALAARLEVQPGGTTPDGRFTLLPIVCLGLCEHAPALMVDGDVHLDVDPTKIDAVLEPYR